jgi:protoporphyrinogen oxidase
MGKTAVIIGAGPAGLTAAYCLLKETDVVPVILEESGEIGGISRTVNVRGNRMDIGGHRFFSKNGEVTALWKTLMPLQGAPSRDDALLGRAKTLAPGGPDPEKEDRVMLLRARVSRIFYLRRFFDYPISLSRETLRNMGFARTIKAGAGYLWASLFKREEKTLRDFLVNRFGMPLYTMFFESYNEKVWGKNPADIAPDWGAQRIRGLSLKKAVLAMVRKALGRKTDDKRVETSLIEQFMYPKYGPGQLWETLADEIKKMGGRIETGKRVTRLMAEQNRITGVGTEDGSAFTADYVISSMPVKDLIKAMEAEIPANVRTVAEGLPYRDFITVGILVSKLKLLNRTAIPTMGNIIPDCWIYVQEPDVKMGRIQIFNNWSPYMAANPEKTVWLGLEYFCDEGDAMWEMPEAEFIRFASAELVKMGMIDAADVLDAARIRVKKAYPAYFGTYERFAEVRDWLAGFENLYCVGRNGQHRYNNMDHSMMTAAYAARTIAACTGAAAIWDINTEDTYHEEKEA